MKRVSFIILSVIAVFLVLVATMRLMGPKMGNTFSTISRELPGSGGGMPSDLMAPAPAEPEFDYAAEDAAQNRSSVVTDSAQAPAVQQERLVIENVQLSIVVKDPQARITEIGDMAKGMGGFVVSSGSYQDTSSSRAIPQASISIRVPSEKLDNALATIKDDASDVPYENRTGEDVTSQYVDLQSQLKAKQAVEKQLLEIMDQATQTKDVLAIYLEVQNVQLQIEQLKGQIKYYEESAAMSLISITLIAEESTQPIQVGPWKPAGAVKEAVQDLVIFFQNFVDFLIYFILNTLPKLILIAIPLYLVYLVGRAIYRRMVKAENKIIEEAKSKREE